MTCNLWPQFNLESRQNVSGNKCLNIWELNHIILHKPWSDE